MTILGLVIGICLVLFACYLVKTFVAAPWQAPLLVIIVVLALAWIAMVFFPSLTSVRVGR